MNQASRDCPGNENRALGREYSIQTFGITRQYKERVAVNGINLGIKQGELFSLLGPNGAGKTTAIKMLCGLVKPTLGTAAIMGHDIIKNATAVKQIINVSPQETAIAGHLNVWENLLLMGGVYGLSKETTKKRAEELIDLMGLTGRTKEQVRKFSGGLQRRLSIAMALITDPQVLFLDEPTLGLDPQARRELWHLIENFKGKKTILLTTHYLEEADALSDRVAIINHGKIIALGTPEELKNNMRGLKTMVIKAQKITSESINGLKAAYPEVKILGKEIEIKGPDLNFDIVVDFLRSKGTKLEGVSMKEPSLDDVFLSFTREEDCK